MNHIRVAYQLVGQDIRVHGQKRQKFFEGLHPVSFWVKPASSCNSYGLLVLFVGIKLRLNIQVALTEIVGTLSDFNQKTDFVKFCVHSNARIAQVFSAIYILFSLFTLLIISLVDMANFTIDKDKRAICILMLFLLNLLLAQIVLFLTVVFFIVSE